MGLKILERGNPYREVVYKRVGVSTAFDYYCIYFVATTLFTPKVFHLLCLFFFFIYYAYFATMLNLLCYYFLNSFLYLRLWHCL